MSDDEEEVESGEENEEEEEEEAEEEEAEEEEEKEDDEETKKKKEKSVNEDLSMIKDIFGYVEKTSSRITEKKQMNETIASLERQLSVFAPPSSNSSPINYGFGEGSGGGNPHVSWSQYENLSDVQRAELLERALMVLAADDSNNNRQQANNRNNR
jgi:vacuolar-type H+-ATPase subunit I/STV1